MVPETLGPDIPNDAEGWGQVDLERTVLPVWDSSSPSTSALTTFMDDNTPLDAGFGLFTCRNGSKSWR